MIRSCTCRGGSASSRAVSRNRLAVASCKTCGGKPVVDGGKGSLSGSMLSSGGLELTTVFNPDLSWKTVSKGSRSAARRPRKPFVRSVEGSSKLVPGSGKGDSKRQVDMPVSESEKLGVTILGRHFRDKIEHIPLKKRRFLFRSPSPPPRVPSPHQQDSVRILKGQRAMAIDNAVANKLGRVVSANEEIHEDFSGILILAAAACNNSIGSCPSDNDEGSAAGNISVLGGSEGLLKSESQLVAEKYGMDFSRNVSLAMEETTILCDTPEEVTKKLTTVTKDVGDGKNKRSSTVERNKDDGTERQLESASRDERLHWDLNVVMDAWEDPCEDPAVDSQANSVQGATIDDCIHSENVQKVIGDLIEPEGEQHSVDEPKGADGLEDSKRSVPGFLESNRDSGLDVCKDAEQSPSFQGKDFSSEIDNATQGIVKETKLVCDKEKFNSDVNTAEDCVTCKPLSEKTRDEKFQIDICKQADCGADAVDEEITVKSSQSQKYDVPLSDCMISNGASLNDDNSFVEGYPPKMNSNLDNVNNEELQADLLIDGIGISDASGVTNTRLDCEDMSNLDASVAEVVHVANVCGSNLGVKNGGNISTEEFAAPGDGDSEKSTHTPEVVETQIAVGSLSSDEVCRSYDHPENNSGKLALEDPFEDSDYGSDVSHDNADPVPVVEKEVEHQTGYDSQYEDGELRESTENNWEEDAGEEVEAEHVDYGSDNREMYGFEAAEEAEVGNDFNRDPFKVKANCKSSIEGFSNSSITETGSSSERTTKTVKQQSRGGYGRTVDIEKLKMDAKVGVSTTASYMGIQENGSCVGGSLVASSRLSSWGKVQESCQSSGVDYRKVDGMGSKDSITGVVGAFAPSVELPIYNEGITSCETFPRKDRAFIRDNRSNNFDDSNPRIGMDGSSKSTVRGGSSVYMHGRGLGADTWVDSSRGSWVQNRHHSPNYYGPANFVYPGATNAAAAAAAKVESDGFIVAPDGTIIKAGAVGPSPSGRVQRQPVNSSLQVGHRKITRRVSPSDREAFGIHMGPEQVGEIIPDRSNGLGRSRSVRYGSRVVQTGPRERYILPDEGIDSSMRRRSISPIQRRGIPHLSQPCTRSRSRSRTLSPNAWPSTRGRCSRSPPNVRSYTRLDRIRSPHRLPGFEPDHMMEYVPISRRRGSPPHTSRWVEDRRDGMTHVREHGYKQQSSDSGRGSPRRVFRRNHRFDVADSSERFRADEYYNRPMHPGRFPEMVGTGRRLRYDGSDDDKRKHGGRYGIVHRTRRYDTGEPVKRFQYDVEDDFPVRSSRNKDISGGFHSSRGGNIKEDYVHATDNRLEEAPSGEVRDDKGHLRYGRNGKYDSISKSFGVRECEDDIAPKRRRP
ncbi:hypothetical protein MKX01_034073 [Papaver californicum]|nr:hypothetical protein MKX01_034073 [Papaver californicum]